MLGSCTRTVHRGTGHFGGIIEQHDSAESGHHHALPFAVLHTHSALRLRVRRYRAQQSGTSLAPDPVSYNVSIKLLCGCGMRDSARILGQLLLESSLTPTATTFEPLLAAAQAAGDHAAVISTWRQAHAWKISLDPSCGLAFIDAASVTRTYGMILICSTADSASGATQA